MIRASFGVVAARVARFSLAGKMVKWRRHRIGNARMNSGQN
jgi:hypothetical protein